MLRGSQRCFQNSSTVKYPALLVISQRVNQPIHLDPLPNGQCQHSLYSILRIGEEEKWHRLISSTQNVQCFNHFEHFKAVIKD